MRLLPSEHACRLRRWLIPATVLALVPKCLLCGLAYAGLGTALGLGGPEICGATGPEQSWTTALPVLGLITASTLMLLRGNRLRPGRGAVHSPGSTSSSSTSKIRPDSGGTLPACMLP